MTRLELAVEQADSQPLADEMPPLLKPTNSYCAHVVPPDTLSSSLARASMSERTNLHSLPSKHDASGSLSENGVKGISLLDAYNNQLQGLDGRSDDLLPANFGKANCLIAGRGPSYAADAWQSLVMRD